MEKKQLESPNLILPSMGIGCWSFGGGKYWGQQSQKDVDAVVHMALHQGINYFDTAEVYNDGESEKALGVSLKGKRNNAVIGTKVSSSNTKSDVLREHCEASLKRLCTDYIDIYFLHWPINEKSIEHFSQDQELISSPPSVEEAFDTLAQLQKEGKIRHIGISNHGVAQMEEIKRTGVRIAVNELPYNLLSRGIEDKILPYCVKEDIGVLGYMALQQGVLAGRYPNVELIPAAQAHSRHFHHSRGKGLSRHGEEGAEEEIFIMLGKMQTISAELKLGMSALSLGWAMAAEGISCTLVGCRNTEQLNMNIQAINLKLPENVLEKLNMLGKPVLEKLGSNPDYYENRNNSRIH